MNLQKIKEAVQELAMENMTEDGVHPDDFPDVQWEYDGGVLEKLAKLLDHQLEDY